MALLTFDTTVADGRAVVELSGELDVSGAVALEAELERLADQDGLHSIILDLGGLEFMDSTGLRLVVLADARARESGHAFALLPGPPTVQRVFEITRMSERLEFVERPEDVTGP